MQGLLKCSSVRGELALACPGLALAGANAPPATSLGERDAAGEVRARGPQFNPFKSRTLPLDLNFSQKQAPVFFNLLNQTGASKHRFEIRAWQLSLLAIRESIPPPRLLLKPWPSTHLCTEQALPASMPTGRRRHGQRRHGCEALRSKAAFLTAFL